MDKHKVKLTCMECGWSGTRIVYDCCCYEDYSPYCRPYSPGPGCPSGYPKCPKCKKETLESAWDKECRLDAQKYL